MLTRTAPDGWFGPPAACGSLPDEILGRPQCADRFPTKFWAVRSVRIASRRNFGPPAVCGSLPDEILGRPQCADRFPTKFWAVRSVRIASRRNFEPPAQCGWLPDAVLGFPRSAGGLKKISPCPGQAGHGETNIAGSNYKPCPWQFLYFLPLPQGHKSFLPTRFSERIGACFGWAPCVVFSPLTSLLVAW